MNSCVVEKHSCFLGANLLVNKVEEGNMLKRRDDSSWDNDSMKVEVLNELSKGLLV